MNRVPWDLVRFFLQVAKSGSLSAAAKVLGVSQPTISRSIQTIERLTKQQLFQRTPQGLILTPAGEKLVEAASGMDEAADLFHRQVSGLSEELSGDIRLSANEIVGIHLLPAALVAFRKLHPQVQIELDISNNTSSLSKREADIALRMYRPTQPDLVARRLANLELAFFASVDYLKTHGEPRDITEFKQHSLIGFDEDMSFIDGASQMGYQLFPTDFSYRTDHMLAQIQLARAGAGIVATHVGLVKNHPELQRILAWLPLPSLEFWLVCHSDTQYNASIRELMTFLGAWFAEDVYRYQLS